MSSDQSVTAIQASYKTPGVDRIFSDVLVDNEIESMGYVATKFAAEGSQSTIYVFSLRQPDSKGIDAFFMPVDVSFGGHYVWHSHRHSHESNGEIKSRTTIRATVWFGKDGFRSARDIQFTLESRDFSTLFKHALMTYAELTGESLRPRKCSKKAA